MLYDYPAKSKFGKSIPKKKIYEYATITNKLKDKIVNQIEKITWQHKLSQDTINLPSTNNVREIQVFDIQLRNGELDIDVLRTIDKAIPFPIIFQLKYNDQLQIKSAYKRVSESDNSKWIVDSYFSTAWLPEDTQKQKLPIVLNLEKLYEEIIKSLMPIKLQENKPLKEQIEDVNKIQLLQKQYAQLKSKRDKEKQFNKKVELNKELKELKNKIKALK